MRQIRPRTTYPVDPPRPVPTTAVSIDLRTPAPAAGIDQLKDEICAVREEIALLVERLSNLVDRREALKAQLLPFTGSDDPSVVAWGFCEDDDL